MRLICTGVQLNQGSLKWVKLHGSSVEQGFNKMGLSCMGSVTQHFKIDTSEFLVMVAKLKTNPYFQ